MKDLRGQTFKGYKLLERRGSGGYGAVYRAVQPSIGREVAVKIIRPEVAGQAQFIRRFEIEAQLIARLEHLHIVPLYDFWRDPGGAYLVMRWLRGGSLAQAIGQSPFDLKDTVQLVDQVASALMAAHSNRVVHRDLKPSNILLDEEGNAYLSDFGIAMDLSRPGVGVRPQETLAGSLDYLSPEQARGQGVSPRTDLYSLGVTLYETLMGEHPFPNLSSVERLYKHINEPLPPIEGLDNIVSEGINQVIQIATAKDPGKRYKDALEMAAALHSAAHLDEPGAPVRVEETLTPREQQILLQIMDGKTNKQIARDLYIEVPTVKWHITQLYRKLGVRSRVQAIVRARELELITTGRDDSHSDGEKTGSISSLLPEPSNPYKGLRPFTAADSRDFFGRERIVDQLLDRLREIGSNSRFIAVLGPSGSGKSSLISAGLIPAIWAGKLPGSERWFVIQMAPGSGPLDELELALTRVAAEQAGNLHSHLSRDSDGLVRAADLILPKDGSELFLVIDQFEELFTLAQNPSDAEHFLDLIYKAVTHSRSRVRVVIALRADFYDRPLHHPGLGELVRSRMETLLPLSAEELERAIIEPARQVGVTFEPGLPARIIEEMLYQPGALPLLQYALAELFEIRDGRVITQSAYEGMGGAVGALALRADEVYLGFGKAGRQSARQMFLRLVSLGEGSVDGAHSPNTSRRVARAELLSLAEEPDLMDEVIDTFGAYRMLSLDHDHDSRQPTVELAHEALIGEWGRLEGWLIESRDDLLQYRRFQALAAEWQRTGKDPGYLLRETRLDQFAGWAGATALVLTPDEEAFLEASLKARESRQEEEERRHRRELETANKLAETEALRARQQAQANRQLRWLAAALSVILMSAIGAALVAWAESGRAAEQARIAFARELASEAVGTLEADPELSIHLALQAVQSTYQRGGTVLPAAEEALHRAIQASRIVSTFPQSGGVAFSPDGVHLVIGGTDGTIGIWDAQSRQLLNSLTGHAEAVTSVAFSPNGLLLATASADHQRIVWDFSAGRPVLELPIPDDPTFTGGLSKVAFSPDSRYLVSTAQFEEAGIWEVASGKEILHFDDSAGPAAEFSPDGNHLALMTAVWDLAGALAGDSGTTTQPYVGPAILSWPERLFDYADPFIEFRATSSEIESAFHEPGSVSYGPAGDRLLTTVISSLAVMRDARTGERLVSLSGHTGVINDTAFGPDGDIVATAGADGTARIWDATSGQMVLVLEGHQDEVFQVVFSPDGRRLATGSLDGTTKVWDISPTGRGEWSVPAAHRGLVSLAFNPGAPQLATMGADGALINLNVQTGETNYTWSGARTTFPGAPSFSVDGELLALADEGGILQLLDALEGDLLSALQVGRPVRIIAFSSDRELVVTGSEDGVLSILDASTGEVLSAWIVQDGFVNGLAFSRDADTLFIAGADGDIIGADLDLMLSGQPNAENQGSGAILPARAIVMSMTGHQDVITHLEISPDGTQLLTSSWDGTARVWDAATGELLHRLGAHKGRVWNAAFSPDGRRIATAGADGAVIMWDSASGERLFDLSWQPQEVFCLDFSADGRFLAISGIDGSVRVYVMPIKDLMDLARERLTRDLTEEECRRYLHLDQCP